MGPLLPRRTYKRGMKRKLGAMALALAALVLTIGACGSASDGDSTGVPSSTPARAVGHGSKTRDCDVVFIGPGPADWRRDTDWIGPFGISRRSFSQGAYETDGSLYGIKTPMIVEGQRPVTISVPDDELDRVGILGVHPKPFTPRSPTSPARTSRGRCSRRDSSCATNGPSRSSSRSVAAPRASWLSAGPAGALRPADDP